MSEPRFQDTLRRERQRRNWSQRDVADRLGIDTNTVSRWERGISLPTAPYTRQKLCKVFNMNAEELGLLTQKSPRQEETTLISQPDVVQVAEASASKDPQEALHFPDVNVCSSTPSVLMRLARIGGIFVLLVGILVIVAASSPSKPVSSLRTWSVYKQGDHGEGVRALQYVLSAHGYHDLGRDADGTFDGKFGPKTAGAVIDFQRKHGLSPADGKVRQATWEALFLNGGNKSGVIVALQRLLNIHQPGAFLIESGVLDQRTDLVLRQFQRTRELPEDINSIKTRLDVWCILLGGGLTAIPPFTQGEHCGTLAQNPWYEVGTCSRLKVVKEGVQAVVDIWCKDGRKLVYCDMVIESVRLKKDGQELRRAEGNIQRSTIYSLATTPWCDDTVFHRFEIEVQVTVSYPNGHSFSKGSSPYFGSTKCFRPQ